MVLFMGCRHTLPISATARERLFRRLRWSGGLDPEAMAASSGGRQRTRERKWVWHLHGALNKNGSPYLQPCNVHQLLPWLVLKEHQKNFTSSIKSSYFILNYAPKANKKENYVGTHGHNHVHFVEGAWGGSHQEIFGF